MMRKPDAEVPLLPMVGSEQAAAITGKTADSDAEVGSGGAWIW